MGPSIYEPSNNQIIYGAIDEDLDVIKDSDLKRELANGQTQLISYSEYPVI
jgi:hypothetical protein